MLRTSLCGFGVALGLLAAAPGSADALVAPATPIDGPAAAIRELGGVAMASDGTGGLVYRKDEGGRAHVYAAQFVDGQWRAPQRVDSGETQRFDSYWPVIAAGDGGRLLVVWVHESGAADRLYSATLDRGARRFQPPVPIDLNVGDTSLGTYPSISMAAGGQAYLVYRVVTDAQPATAPPGTVLGEYRLARYTGQLWSGYGIPLNRSAASPQPAPTAANRPRIGVDQLGNALVAWQELDDDLIARIYARRVFPASTGIAIQVSPRELDGRLVRAPADRLALDVGRFGEAAIAWRQQPADGGAFTRPRALVAMTPDAFSTEAARFGAPRPFDGAGADGPAAALGSVDVSIAEQSLITGLGTGTAAITVGGTETTVDAAERVDAGSGGVTADPVLDLASSGAAALAWRTGAAGRGGVVVRERRADGVASDRAVSAPRGGSVDELDLAGSGFGDAIVAFTQGAEAGRQIAAAVVDAPPDVFNAQTPVDFVRASSVDIAWDPSAHAIGGISYAVVVDDDTIADGLRGTRFRVPTADLPDGARAVTIVATDAAGQETTSVPAELRLDRRAPVARVSLRGRRVRVSVSDGRGRSGVRVDRVLVRFGDGARAAGRARAAHRYRRPGRYRVVVSTVDRAGNRATARRSVVVR